MIAFISYWNVDTACLSASINSAVHTQERNLTAVQNILKGTIFCAYEISLEICMQFKYGFVITVVIHAPYRPYFVLSDHLLQSFHVIKTFFIEPL